MNAEASASQDHERKDADVTSIFMIVILLFLSIGLVLLVAAVLMHYFRLTEPAAAGISAGVPAGRVEKFPPPRLVTKPGMNLAELRAAEDIDLTSYGWIDRNAGKVRIPIDRAMQLIVARGLPDVGAGQTPLSLMQDRPNEMASPPQSTPTP